MIKYKAAENLQRKKTHTIDFDIEALVKFNCEALTKIFV